MRFCSDAGPISNSRRKNVRPKHLHCFSLAIDSMFWKD